MTDPLLEATRALREFGERNPNASDLTRARVVASLAVRRRQQKRRWVMAIPLAALAMGSVAMAATGGYLPAPVQQWVAEHAAFIPNPVAKRARVASRVSVAKLSNSPAVAGAPKDSGQLNNSDVPAPKLTAPPQPDQDGATTANRCQYSHSWQHCVAGAQWYDHATAECRRHAGRRSGV